MTPLYLRYRNATTDPWNVPPSLSSSVPGIASGAVPLDSMTLRSGPELLTPCGCSSTDPYLEDHYALHAGLTALPQSVMPSIATYLLQYKEAAYHEAMHSLYADGGFVSAELSQLTIKNEGGRSAIEFRLAATIEDVI
jgi:hypothetical protein